MIRRIPETLLRRMADQLSEEDRDEMAIPSYLHPNPMLRWMAWRRVEVLARQMRDLTKKYFSTVPPVIMDYGCGTGVLFQDASELATHIYGVDLVLTAARLLLEEEHLPKVTLYTPEEAGVRLAEKSIDMILAPEVLEHIDPLGPTLDFFRRVLSVKGRLLVSLPTEGMVYKLGRWLAGFHGQYHHHNAASIHRQIVKAGFRLDRLQKIPLPGPFSVYWVCSYHAC